MRAAFAGHSAMVRMLLRAGADPRVADSDGHDAAERAEAGGHAEIAAMLREVTPM